MVAKTINDRAVQLLTKLGLASLRDVVSTTPLSGGVASDIYVVDLGGRMVCVKFALAKLRVAEEWHASVGRSAAEYAWLHFAGTVVPACVPVLYGRDDELNGFVMEYVQGQDTYLWKNALLDRQPCRGEGAKVGDALGMIHAASTGVDFPAEAFRNQADFNALRLEPYLDFTASVHPDLAESLHGLADDLRHRSMTLVHGDISPKNILFRGDMPVFLDAECATLGDPAFDVAFCLNHLALKSIHMPDQAPVLHAGSLDLWNGYAQHVVWEDCEHLEGRICRLLPALMLARLDGKSPIEYLGDAHRDDVRALATGLIKHPPSRLPQFLAAIDLR